MQIINNEVNTHPPMASSECVKGCGSICSVDMSKCSGASELDPESNSAAKLQPASHSGSTDTSPSYTMSRELEQCIREMKNRLMTVNPNQGCLLSFTHLSLDTFNP